MLMALVIALLLVGVSILLHWADAHRERERVRKAIDNDRARIRRKDKT